jgi:SAM-dependent methyltransferase
MSNKDNDINNLKIAYQSRTGPNLNNYSWFYSDVCLYRQERDRVMLQLLKKAKMTNLSELDIFEVGCGFGDNLLNLIKLGALPQKIWGSDIIDSRVKDARSRLPESVNLFVEDSSADNHNNTKSFNLILQFTVFSSILSDKTQLELASKLMSLLQKDGYILWYDFIYSNPKNKSVRGVSKSRIKELFPNAEITFKKVTLAPPIGRALVRRAPFLSQVLNLFPILKTHTFALIKK